jgi:tungstate transport system substrate-binding protein
MRPRALVSMRDDRLHRDIVASRERRRRRFLASFRVDRRVQPATAGCFDDEEIMKGRWARCVRLVAVSGVVVALTMVLSACGSTSERNVQRDQLVVATTTSLNDSGLLEDVILPAFRERHPQLTVKVVAVGSGEAIAMGVKGEADVLLVHSPADEEKFMADGHGTLRLPFAYNHFVIVGPQGDPASVSKADTAAAAFAAIAEAEAAFISRGDESGTHKKELKIWDAAGIDPAGDWYLTAGQGMGETLRIASEKEGYTLTDLGTFLSQKASLDLVALSPESADLKNVYDVIIVNQNDFSVVNSAAAELLAHLLTSSDGQKMIAEFGREQYRQPLFRPYAKSLGNY